jgi:hypothetical protein
MATERNTTAPRERRAACEQCGNMFTPEAGDRIPSHRVAGTADQRCTGSWRAATVNAELRVAAPAAGVPTAARDRAEGPTDAEFMRVQDAIETAILDAGHRPADLTDLVYVATEAALAGARRDAELERLRARDRLLRHYLGTIAHRIGRPTTWSAIQQPAEIEEVGEGVLAELERLREDVAMYERWAARSPAYDAECPCGRRVSVRTVATEDIARWRAMEQRGWVTVPVTIALDGPTAAPIVLELDGGGRVELTADQARTIAASLDGVANEAQL